MYLNFVNLVCIHVFKFSKKQQQRDMNRFEQIKQQFINNLSFLYIRNIGGEGFCKRASPPNRAFASRDNKTLQKNHHFSHKKIACHRTSLNRRPKKVLPALSTQTSNPCTQKNQHYLLQPSNVPIKMTKKTTSSIKAHGS